MKTLEVLQDGLYHAAKENRNRKFHSLHDKICRYDILQEAWKRVSENKGSPGIDNQTIEDIRSYGVDIFLKELQGELENRTYRIPKVKRVYIPKPNGKQRPLGIPTIRDRVVQQAVKSIIEPIFEADFKDFSYAYRKGRSAIQAAVEIRKHLYLGYTNVVEIDISGFFDHIDHDKMIFFVMRRIADPYVIKLIREWLRAGIVYKGNVALPEEGTPQGGVISPLLANIYLNEMDTLWTKKVPKQEARIIRYADDEIILSTANPGKYMDLAGRMLGLLDLELNTEKSGITDINKGFDFLGIHYQRRYSNIKKRDVIITHPSQKSMDKFRDRVKDTTRITKTSSSSMHEIVDELNLLIRGWTQYFNNTNPRRQYRTLQMFMDWKVSKFYCIMHKIPRSSENSEYLSIGRRFGLIRITGQIPLYNAAR